MLYLRITWRVLENSDGQFISPTNWPRMPGDGSQALVLFKGHRVIPVCSHGWRHSSIQKMQRVHVSFSQGTCVLSRRLVMSTSKYKVEYDNTCFKCTISFWSGLSAASFLQPSRSVTPESSVENIFVVMQPHFQKEADKLERVQRRATKWLQA